MKRKLLKKRFSTLLALLFIFTQLLIAFPVGAEIQEELFLDFENESSEGWVFEAGANTGIESESPFEPNKVLRFDYMPSGTSGSHSYAKYNLTETLSGKIVLDLNYKNTNTKINAPRVIQLKDSSNNTFLEFGVGHNETGAFYIKKAGVLEEGPGLTLTEVIAEPNSWHHLTLILDTASSTVEKFYINGSIQAEDLSYAGAGGTDLKEIQLYNRIRSHVSTWGELFIDNLRARTFDVTDTLPPFSKYSIKTVGATTGNLVTVDLSSEYFDVNGLPVTLTSDSGSVTDEKVLTYTPEEAGMQTVLITVDNGTTSDIYPLRFNVINDLNLNFETGTLADNGMIVEKIDNVALIEDPHDPYNRVYRSYGIYGQTFSSYYTFETPITNKVIFECNYKNPLADVGNERMIKFYNSDEFDESKYLFAIGTGSGSGNYILRSNISGIFQNIVTIESSIQASKTEWAHFAIIYDPANKKIDKWYINGELVTQVEDYELPVNSSVSGEIKLFSFHHNTSKNNANVGALYFDNFKAKTIGANVAPVALNRYKTQTTYVGKETVIDLSNEFFDIEGDEIVISSSEGTINSDAKVLTYTPATSGLQEITLTASDGINSTKKPIKINVINGKKVTVVKTGNGDVTFEGDTIVTLGDTFEITATPADGYSIEYIKLNGSPVVAYQNGEKIYTTPPITTDTVINVKFSEVPTNPEVIIHPTAFTDNTEISGITFATARPAIGTYARVEYGMLFSKTELTLDDFIIDGSNVIKAMGDVTPNMLGQYGVKFIGNGIVSNTTYFTRAYAIYKDGDAEVIVYGNNIVPFTTPVL